MRKTKKHLFMLSLFAAGAMMVACNEAAVVDTPVAHTTEASDEEYYATRMFAEPDNAKDLYNHANGVHYALRLLLEKAGPGIINSLGSINITEEQYQEIKEFTDSIVAGKSSQKEQYTTIFNWVSRNIKYNNPTNNPQNKPYPNDPYDTFINRMAVCQGYASLEVVMCLSQGIPAMMVNGLLNPIGGHAWLYACPDDTWYVSDPTNGMDYVMKKTAPYGHLVPQRIDMDLFTDDVAVYNFQEYALNIKEVTTTVNPFVVPYSVEGFVISAFNPSVALPKEITEIYIGQNIRTLGEPNGITLEINGYGRYLQAVHVDENNPSLMSHEGIVYTKGSNIPYYIPGGMTFIKMKPMEVVEKNTIKGHKAVKEIYFPEGTKRLEGWAIEDCPKLERVYVPEDAEVSSAAIPKNVEVLRGIPSGIKHVTID